MAVKKIDPKETYVVRSVLCCGVGHCPGVRYTHWESGEACIYGGHDGCSNEEVHFYWRLVLVPRYRGNPDKSANQYAKSNGDLWEHLNLDENVNKPCHFAMAPKGWIEGQTIKPGRLAA